MYCFIPVNRWAMAEDIDKKFILGAHVLSFIQIYSLNIFPFSIIPIG